METTQTSPAVTFTAHFYLSQYDVRRRSNITTEEAARKVAREMAELGLYCYEARSACVTIEDGTAKTGRTIVEFRKAAGAGEVEVIEVAQ